MPRIFVGAFVVLFAFWVTMVVIVTTTAALALRPGEDTSSRTSRSQVATQEGIDALIRPSTVPASAQRVTADVVLGEDSPDRGTPFDQQHIFYALRCDDHLLTVATSKEVVYAQLDCGLYWLPDDVVHPFLAQPVRVRAAAGSPSQLSFESGSGQVGQFVADAVWIESRQ